VAVNEMNPESIRVDQDVRARVGLDEDTVEQMAEAMRAGNWFPPVDVFFDGTHHWLADGFYRHPAHVRAGKPIRARVHRGTRDDAALFACGANKEHDTAGLRRTNADKRLAVEKTLQLKPEWSGGRVAHHCGVTPQFANQVRRELEQSGQPGPPGQVETNSTCPAGAGPAARQGLDGKSYPVPSARAAEGARPQLTVHQAGGDATKAAPQESVGPSSQPPKPPGRTMGPYHLDAADVPDFDRKVKDLMRVFGTTGVFQTLRKALDVAHEVHFG
jgi:hypothetical protein